MAADLRAIRHWLLDEARALQQQQDAARVRLTVLRSIMRLVADHEAVLRQQAPEADS